MSRTLLYTVQRVLENLDLDDVNSINDTPDSILIAREAEDTIYDLISRNEWPQRQDLIQVESVSDPLNPSALRLSDDTLNITSIRYDVTETGASDKTLKELTRLDPEDFLNKIYNRKSSETNVVTVDYNGADLFIYNDKAPEYYTVFDNQTIILDSFDSSVESTVNGSKTVVRGSKIPSFVMDDLYVIPFDINTYPLFLAELTAACSLSLNGTNDSENERRRNRGMSRLRRSANRTATTSFKNNFGREGTGRS